jgi:hypothetical protein
MVMMQMATAMGLYMIGFDVDGAFLLANNDYENYAFLPPSLAPEGKRRVLVKKAWYGEKQAPKLWNDLFTSKIESIGYVRCPDSPCLYLKISNQGGVNGMTMLSLHVDDGLVGASSQFLIEEFKRDVLSLFNNQIHFMEPINVYTAVSIDYDREARIMKLNQTRYVNEELAYREDRGGSKLCSIGSVAATPMFNTSMNLRLQEPNPNNESLLEYTGKLRYVVDRTRPGCLNAVGEISVGGNVNPSDLHIKTLNKLRLFIT